MADAAPHRPRYRGRVKEPHPAPGNAAPAPDPALLAHTDLQSGHARLRDWETDEDRHRRLTAWHADNLELLTSMDIAHVRADHFALPGLHAEHYLDRWEPAAQGLHALLSIRFENLDVQRPFVNVSGLSRPWTPADLPALRDAANRAYHPFRPATLRLTTALPVDALPGLTPEFRFLTAPLQDLARPDLTLPPELTLRPTTDDTHLQDARDAYAALDAQHPAHARQAQVIGAEQLADTVQAGLMYDVLVHGEWAGYVGAQPAEEIGLDVLQVQELLLTPRHRGHGYGPHLGTLFARTVLRDHPDHAHRHLFGTIHAHNHGAYPAALRAGRHDVGGYTLLPLR